MAPYKALYGRNYRSLVRWDNIRVRKLLGPDLILQTVEKEAKIKKYMKATQDRQKKWADAKRRPLEFTVGDHVFFKISPTRGVIRFGFSGKLSLRYIGPFHIIERVREVAYRLALPPALDGVHDVFHISKSIKYVRDDQHILDYSNLRPNHDLSYKAQSIGIIDKKEKVLKNKTIPLVLVSWDLNSPVDSTWEREDKIGAKYPHLFSSNLSHF